MKTVSIIIPTFNHANFIVRTIESCVNQTYPNIEIIVVDDGSTDNTKEIVESFQTKIKYIYQKNKGPSAARNKGFHVSTGEYLLFLDSDDWIHPKKIQLQAEILDKKSDYGLVYSGWNYVEEVTESNLGEIRFRIEDNVLEALLMRNLFFSPGAALIRRSCFLETGLFDESPEIISAEDTDMWVRLAAAGVKFTYIDESLLFNRVVMNSLSKNHEKHFQSEYYRLQKFFTKPGMKKNIQSLKSKSISLIHFEYAAKFYNIHKISKAQTHLIQAIKLSPELANDSNWILEWISGYCLDPEVKEPETFIKTLFSNLPNEAQNLKFLLKKAVGQYHAVSIFNEFRNQNYSAIPPHIMPAISGNLKIITNIGFLKIILISIFKSQISDKG